MIAPAPPLLGEDAFRRGMRAFASSMTAVQDEPEADTAGPLWTPLDGPQTMAYFSPADELYYGGAAGGGKTDLLIGLALTAHRRSIIFRREFPQLKAIIDRSREVIGERGAYNGQAATWRLTGRQLEFGAVQYAHDVSKFQGRPHDLKAFDELPNFLESQYRFLIGWNRTVIPGQRTRVVSAGNPPTDAEGEWVIRYWAPWLDPQHPNPAMPGELRWFATVAGEDQELDGGDPFVLKGETIQPRSRTFIPAKLSDNPHLLNTGYAATLQAMPEPLRSQLLYGDFGIGLDDDPWQVIPTAWVRAAQERWTPEGRPPGAMDCLGVDVARGGRDKTVLAPRYGHWFGPLQRHAGTATPDGPMVASLVLKALLEAGEGSSERTTVNVDVIGVGSSVYDTLRPSLGDRVDGVNVATSSDRGGRPFMDRAGKLKMVNLRAHAYWALREALDPDKGDDLALPPDAELRADLCSAKWSLQARGVLVEAKEDIIKRIGRSPDAGDALALAHLLLPRPKIRLLV